MSESVWLKGLLAGIIAGYPYGVYVADPAVDLAAMLRLVGILALISVAVFAIARIAKRGVSEVMARV